MKYWLTIGYNAKIEDHPETEILRLDTDILRVMAVIEEECTRWDTYTVTPMDDEAVAEWKKFGGQL